MHKNSPTHFKVAIIGGGAAGMMAAVALQESGFDGEVLLFEKNAYLGAKVIISGGGRCNVTTGITEVKKLLENYPRGTKFLMSAMFRFPPEQVMEWFESHGVPLKTEKDLRVFPQSNNGKDVVGALQRVLKKNGVQVYCNAAVQEVKKEGKIFTITLKDGRSFNVDAVIITTGGTAYRHTGSTGDGYAFAMGLGHTITPLAPSLHSFILSETWPSKVAGVSFAQVELTLQGQDTYTRKGPIVFTHKGISGPAVFAISSMAAYEVFNPQKPLKLFINFLPQESAEALKNRFSSMLIQHHKKQLINFVDIFLPKSLCAIFLQKLSLDPTLFVSRLGRKEKEAMLEALQHFECTIVGRGAGDEFVTAGGVKLEEVHSHSMESKLCSGLYFAGEVLDIDGFTGGFNLQASWATGRLAGESVGKASLN